MYYIVFGWFWLWYGLQCFSLFKFFLVSLYGDYVQYNGGLLPDIILLTQCYGTTFKCHDVFKEKSERT